MSHWKFLSSFFVILVFLTLASAFDCSADSAYFTDLDTTSSTYGDTVATGLCACLDFDTTITGTDSTVTLTILLLENEPIRGFQFEIIDDTDDALVLRSVKSGSEIIGWTVPAMETSKGSALIFGFSPSGEETVPDSEEILLSVTFDIVGRLGKEIAFYLDEDPGVLLSDEDAENVVCSYPSINDPISFSVDWLETKTNIVGIPEEFALMQNFPNPFNPETTIRFQLKEMTEVEVSVYNILGQKVISLTKGVMPAGYHEIRWAGRDQTGMNVASGVYIYTFRAGDFFEQKKMVLLR